MKKAIYPGSFDPIHLGHLDIIDRIAKVFDHVVVLIAESPNKKSLFSIDERKEMIQKSLKHLSNVSVEAFDGLTVDYAEKNKAQTIVRGLRAVVDFEYEMTMANMNKKLKPKIETMLVFASPEYYFLSSRGIKEVANHQGELSGLVPDVVKEPLKAKMR